MLAVAAAYVALSGRLNNILPSAGDQGFVFPSVAAWGLDRWWSLGLNVGGNLLIMALMIIINKAFNVLRAITWLQVGLFGIMQAAVPREVLALNSGTLVCVAVAYCIFLLFSCYNAPEKVRTVFLAFLVLSLGTTAQYCFTLYIVVCWLMLIQMRIFSMRVFVASVLGIVTVWIILFGFGLISPADLHLPSITGIMDVLDLHSAVYLLSLTAGTTFLLVLALGANLMKTIAYNARARAYNGALTVLSLVTVVAVAADFENLLAYLPLLNLCTAYQITHYFVNHRYERQYIAVLAVCGFYFALYLWRLSL